MVVAGGPENVCIDQLVWKNSRDLLVVTHGRGVYQATVPLAATQPIGTGCATGTPPVLTCSPPIVGGTAQFGMTGTLASTPVLFAWHIGPPLTIPVGACPVHIDLPAAALVLAGTTTATGTWTFGLPLPPLPGLVGLELTTQALVFAANGPMLGLGDLSTGLRVFLGL
jgi:hypothetical protein